MEGSASNAKKDDERPYVILASVDGGKTWTLEGKQVAGTKAQAASYFYEERPLPESDEPVPDGSERVDPSEYVLVQAIPESTWKNLKPAPPRPRVPFGEA